MIIKKLYKIALFFALLFSAGSLFAQQTGREKGIELYRQGNYKEAVKTLNAAVKNNPNDAEAQTFLSLSLLKTGKLKAAEKALGKTLALNPNQPAARKALAYVFLLRGKLEESVRQAQSVISMGSPDAESYYILGLANFRVGKLEAALENADQAIKLDPKMANAYLLKAHAIMNHRSGTMSYSEISAKYGTSADNIGKFILLSADLPNPAFWRGQEETLRTFAAYYAEQEKLKSSGQRETGEMVVKPVKILAKPRAAYTDNARENGISGTIRLLVAFSENGTVGNVLILSSLGYGLDEQAVKAARGIKFEPETRNGKPVMSVKSVEYSFMIY